MKSDPFSHRHMGPRQPEIKEMLEKIGVGSIDELVEKTIPSSIYNKQALNLPEGLDEHTLSGENAWNCR